MAKLEREQSYQSFASSIKKPNLSHFYNFLFLALGLTLGLITGFIIFQKSLLFSSVSLASLPPFLSLSDSTNVLPSMMNSKNNNNLGHSMSDEELLWKASMVPEVKEYPFEHVPKVAFMFLTKRWLPLAPLWEMFFKGHQGFYSIYVHTTPEYDESWPETSIFYGRRIPSQPVQWGNISMIDAERRLLANALLDFSNQRFVLLSESCIPVFNFTTVYNYLMNSKLSFLHSFDWPGKDERGRYNPRMAPDITVQDWRKGAQWFEVHRELAIHMVSDRKYYAIFKEHCHRPCYSDEHYFPTLVNKRCPGLIANKSVTWVDWSHVGPHPGRFIKNDITEEFLHRIRFGAKCTYNGKLTNVCYMFARKFVGDTVPPLLKIAPKVMGFEPLNLV